MGFLGVFYGFLMVFLDVFGLSISFLYRVYHFGIFVAIMAVLDIGLSWCFLVTSVSFAFWGQFFFCQGLCGIILGFSSGFWGWYLY